MNAATAKGEARRSALLDAVIRVLEEGGPGAVTHRAVAAEAGVPLAAATYYFAGRDDLLESAILRTTDEDVALFRHLRGGSLASFSRALFAWTHEGRASAIAQYELLFLALRRPALRAAADRWFGSIASAVGERSGRSAQSEIAALAIDGLILRMLWHDDPSTPAELTRLLARILDEPADDV